MPAVQARKLADVAAVIKAKRQNLNLSQADLATRMAFSRDYMVDLESGRSNLFASRMFRVLHELGITVTLEYEDQHDEP